MASPTTIRRITPRDPAPMAAAFAAIGWGGKDISQFERYLQMEESGERAVLIAEHEGAFAGYLTLTWGSDDPELSRLGIPEVNDLNVLPALQRRGIGAALMDKAEQITADRTDVIGIGVGLHHHYGQAQRMYVQRGYVFDGRGVVYEGRTVQPGESVPIDDSACLWLTKRLRD